MCDGGWGRVNIQNNKNKTTEDGLEGEGMSGETQGITVTRNWKFNVHSIDFRLLSG